MSFLKRLFGNNAPPPEPIEPEIAIAMIALPSPEWFDPAAVTSAFAAEAKDQMACKHVELKDNVATFEIADCMLFAAMMPAPIPWGDLEGPCATALAWPEAADQMRTHTAHYIVTIQGDGSPLHHRVLLTRLVSAILAAQACTGVYWGGGTVVHSPQYFRELSEGISKESFPPMLWIDFRVVPGEGGGVTLFTTGMKSMGLMEIEAQNAKRKPSDVYERAADLSCYLITNGPVIGDGHTIGITATEKILVRHRVSMFPERGPVYQVHF